jgi:hypothetical protein
MMKQFVGTVLFAILCLSAAAQNNFWQTLAEVGFQSKKDSEGHIIETPVFSKNLKTWNGKRIRLKGYVIPVSEIGDQDKFMLSALPFNVCYFCGAAGPETVIEVEASEKIRFSGKPIWVEGVLYLNEKDPEHHMYILKSAKTIAAPTTATAMKEIMSQSAP